MTVDARRSRRFKHVFLDAEGTIYVPHRGKSTWEFWADPSPEHAKDFFRLDEGVAEALASVRARVDSLCVVSKNSKAVLDALLDDFGIRDYFDEVILNGDKGKKISRYLSERGYDHNEAVMVGDTPALDLYPVRKAGIEAILVDRPYNRGEDAERIRGVRDLPSWLRIADLAEKADGPRATTLDDFLAPALKGTQRLISASGC